MKRMSKKQGSKKQSIVNDNTINENTISKSIVNKDRNEKKIKSDYDKEMDFSDICNYIQSYGYSIRTGSIGLQTTSNGDYIHVLDIFKNEETGIEERVKYFVEYKENRLHKQIPFNLLGYDAVEFGNEIARKGTPLKSNDTIVMNYLILKENAIFEISCNLEILHMLEIKKGSQLHCSNLHLLNIDSESEDHESFDQFMIKRTDSTPEKNGWYIISTKKESKIQTTYNDTNSNRVVTFSVIKEGNEPESDENNDILSRIRKYILLIYGEYHIKGYYTKNEFGESYLSFINDGQTTSSIHFENCSIYLARNASIECNANIRFITTNDNSQNDQQNNLILYNKINGTLNCRTLEFRND